MRVGRAAQSSKLNNAPGAAARSFRGIGKRRKVAVLASSGTSPLTWAHLPRLALRPPQASLEKHCRGEEGGADGFLSAKLWRQSARVWQCTLAGKQASTLLPLVPRVAGQCAQRMHPLPPELPTHLSRVGDAQRAVHKRLHLCLAAG